MWFGHLCAWLSWFSPVGHAFSFWFCGVFPCGDTTNAYLPQLGTDEKPKKWFHPVLGEWANEFIGGGFWHLEHQKCHSSKTDNSQKPHHWGSMHSSQVAPLKNLSYQPQSLYNSRGKSYKSCKMQDLPGMCTFPWFLEPYQILPPYPTKEMFQFKGKCCTNRPLIEIWTSS